MTDESLFAEALALPGPAARPAFLDRACGGDPARRQGLERLLAARPAGRLPGGLPGDPATPGTRIDPYTLRQKLGVGGMGEVWAADRTDPVRRRVAVKLVKAGLDTARVVARFAAERQALALMDHPHIGRVFDAGTAPARPAVLRHGAGRGGARHPLLRRTATDCPRTARTVRTRVPGGAAHPLEGGGALRPEAGQRAGGGAGRPAPVVIDFGAAKATLARLADRTLDTELGAVVGTLEYMAPEQAELSALDVDTRADVYALGVLLYELLTGSTPLTRDRLKAAGLAEVLRLIREEEPPRPSTRWASPGSGWPGWRPPAGPTPGGSAGGCGANSTGSSRGAWRRTTPAGTGRPTASAGTSSGSSGTSR